MKMPGLSRLFLAIVVAAGSLAPATASACSACMGDPSSKTAGAANGAIFLMLGFIALMLGFVGAFVYHLAKRANAPVPPHVEATAAMTAEDDFK
jgi:4-amino-4-deoxy-L-arabinose transferase-like glycosyltransferase